MAFTRLGADGFAAVTVSFGGVLGAVARFFDIAFFGDFFEDFLAAFLAAGFVAAFLAVFLAAFFDALLAFFKTRFFLAARCFVAAFLVAPAFDDLRVWFALRFF